MKPSPKHGCTECYGAREVTKPAHEFTFMGRTFKAGAREVACPECSVAVVQGVRTHSTTRLTSLVRVTLECIYRENQPLVAIADGGVTGHESVYFDDRFLDLTRARGWWACAGTAGRYDSLFVPPQSMRAAFEKLRLV